MKAARIHRFGAPDVIVIDDLPIPTPGDGEVVVHTSAAGVGNWDALIREGKAPVSASLPFTLGGELAGAVTATGPGVSAFHVGDEVYGATNAELYGAYSEFAVAKVAMLAQRPRALNDIEAASVPVVAVTAWQMLFEYAHATAGQTVLIHGGAGNVGAYAVQLARQAGLRVVATAAACDTAYVQRLGAAQVIDYETTAFEDVVSPVDLVIDTVGGATLQRSYAVAAPGGIVVSIVTPFPPAGQHPGVRDAFLIVDVTTARLDVISDLFDRRKLVASVGTILPLKQARNAHEMLSRRHRPRGKIVLRMEGKKS